MGVAAWIGPAIIAALISSIVTVIGWYVAFERERKAEVARRQEKIRDIQTALLAEITSDRAHFGFASLEEEAANIVSRFETQGDAYTPFVPRDASAIVFDTILPEIHILPSEVIAPIVTYYKTATIIAHFISDLKSETYAKLGRDPKQEMYMDYLGMIKKALREADEAGDALKRSLRSGAPLNSPALGPAARRR